MTLSKQEIKERIKAAAKADLELAQKNVDKYEGHLKYALIGLESTRQRVERCKKDQATKQGTLAFAELHLKQSQYTLDDIREKLKLAQAHLKSVKTKKN